MKILVTGGAGFIGSNLTIELQKRFPSADITVLDNLSSGSVDNLKTFRGKQIHGNVEDENLIESLIGKGFDSIYHLAAITDTTISDSGRMMRVNVDGFKNILRIAEHENAHVAYASSAGVYGNGSVPMKESQTLSPLNAYALSKVRMDEIAASAAKPLAVGLRYFNVYGPGESNKGKSASMIWQLAQKIKKGNQPRIFKYGEQVRDHIYVKDVVCATITAMEALNKNKFKNNFAVNIGTGKAVTFNRIIEILNEVLHADFKPEYFDNPYSFYQNNTQADTTLTAETLGFKAKYTIEDGIKDYLDMA